MIAARGLAWLLVLPMGAGCAPGCTRKPKVDACGPYADDRPAQIEIRDGQGALLLAARALPGRAAAVGPAGSTGDLTLCDPAGRAAAVLGTSAKGFTLKDEGGEVLSSIGDAGDAPPGREAAGAGEPALRWPRGMVRLHQSGALLRLLDGGGVPIGQIEKQPERAITFDPAGRGIATSERVEKQDDSRLAVRAPDGTTRFILLGLHSERAAAAFALPDLPLPERLLLARYLDAR